MENKLMPIGKLFNLEKGQLQSTKCTPGEYDFITAAAEWKSHNEYNHEGEALIFAAAASGSLGRTHYVDGKFISSDLCFILTPKNEQKYPLNLAFYHFVFNSLRPVIVTATKSGTSKESINQTNFKKYKLPYFNIDQQDLWMGTLKNTQVKKELLISELSLQQTLLKKLRQSILQDAISGKLTQQWRKKNPDVEPASELLKRIKAEKDRLVKEKKIKKQKPLPPITEDEIPFELPKGWAWCRLGDVCLNMSTGPFGSMLHKSDYVGDGIPLVNPINLINNKIYPNNKMMVNEKTKSRLSQFVLKAGDIVIARRGDLSKCAIVSDREAGWLCGTGSFFISISKYISQYFFLYFYISNFCQGILNNNSVGSTMNNLNQKLLQNLPLPFAPKEEQKNIIDLIQKAYNICDELESQSTKSQQDSEMLMQAVLKEAFEG